MKRLAAAVLIAALMGVTLLATQADGARVNVWTVSTTSKGWQVILAVNKNTVRTGTTFMSTITVWNRTGHPVTVEGCQPNFDFSVVLANAKVPYEGLSGAVACSTVFHEGSTVFRAPITAVYPVCGGPGQPSCANPDLPAGKYHTVVNWPSGPPRIPKPGQLTIHVVR